MAEAITKGGRSVYDRDNGQAGMASMPIDAAVSQITNTAQQARIARVCPSRPIKVVSVAFSVDTAAGSDDPCDVGVYDGLTLAKLGSSGATTGKLNSTGAKAVNLSTPVVLTAGKVYYLAFAYGTVGTTAAQLGGASLINAGHAQLFGSAAPNIECGLMASAYPLPSTFTIASSASKLLLAARES